MTTDEWVTAALTDDAVVVDLLLRLKQSSDSSSSQHLKPPPAWGHRRPRSKPPAATSRKERESMRFSPTTPLSWSSGGGASDCSDESCRPSDRSSGSRSKGISSEITATATINKRLTRKKTFAELKEEESLLLKERLHLKKELATLSVALEEQKAKSENLKRLKLDLHLQSACKIDASSSACTLARIVPLPLPPTTTAHQDLPPPFSRKVETEIKTEESCFILPDLNMTPFEDNSGYESLYGLS
ncbi:Drebrin-like protein [Actinidia chinensis var. chinensis]|uniref:Drebrin-like protein n=1 Tax=Actinidia chinensis var. chinensis TaxID=1590841 RepID=A0A2R6Q2K7_ACTCC|nr:Drebrin-like protein [Actinidia chinensis var. chinensis]